MTEDDYIDLKIDESKLQDSLRTIKNREVVKQIQYLVKKIKDTGETGWYRRVIGFSLFNRFWSHHIPYDTRDKIKSLFKL